MITKPKIDESTYCPERGMTHAHKCEDGVWRYITREELYAAYRHQPDPEAALE